MAAPGQVQFTNNFHQWLGDGTFDMDADTFAISIHSSTLVPNAATMSVFSDFTNEVTGGGYVAGGVTLTGVTWVQTAGVCAFKSGNNPSWTATGANWAGRYAVIRKVGTANARVNPVIGWFVLDSTPADVTFVVGQAVTITQHANGWFTV